MSGAIDEVSAPVLLPPPVSPRTPPARSPRVEYLGFRNVGEHREFRLRICRPEGSTEFCLRIAIAAFTPGGARLQDGPDVCYQALMRTVAAGETPAPGVITIDPAELASYVQAHTRVPKHRSWTPAAPTDTLATVPPPRRRFAPPPVAPPVTHDGEPALEEGQRVSHSVFGTGVTTSSNRGHTVVRFDQAGPKTFVTSMLKLDVLSGPHTWETTARGNNRPCRVGPAA